jgi:hypothetical protein
MLLAAVDDPLARSTEFGLSGQSFQMNAHHVRFWHSSTIDVAPLHDISYPIFVPLGTRNETFSMQVIFNE